MTIGPRRDTLTPFLPHGDSLTYESFFGLREKPFSLNSDPRFLYQSPSHASAFDDLSVGIRRREGLLVLTGDIGTGKTTLCRAVLRNLGRKTFSAFVPDPFASREDLLKMLLIDFGVMSIQDLTTGALKGASRTELSYLLSAFLETLAPLDAFAVVVIDEAQNMSLPLIEETRILSDSYGRRGQLQLVFVGQLELHAKLKLPEMRQVDQRVCVYSRLAPLSPDAVSGYVQHRLHVAGASADRVIFSPEVFEVLHRRSGGVPRLINRICDRALHLAHQRQSAIVDREFLDAALIDVGQPEALLPQRSTNVLPVAAVPAGPAVTPAVAMPPAVTESPGITAWPALTAPPAVTASPAASDATPVPTPATTPPSLALVEDFSKSVDEWLTRAEVNPAIRKPTPLRELPREKPAPKAPPVEKTGIGRVVRSSAIWRKTDDEPRPQRYMERVRRRWVKRFGVAAVCLVALNVVAVGASYLPNALANLMGPPALPALPSTPTLAVPAPLVPATPSLETPEPAVAASGEYLIAVALFTTPERGDRLVEELTQAGFRAYRRPLQLRSQRVLQQVVIGPFPTRVDALGQLERVHRIGGYEDAKVVDPESMPTTP